MRLRRHLSRTVIGLAILPIVGQGVASAQETTKPATENVEGIFIASDKRHQGVSRFDLFPFTDRPKGDLDRYRAVNPNFVQKQDGHYYYLLEARPGIPYFDENLNKAGTLTETQLSVDFGKTREAKDAAGKTIRYVFVRDKGFVLRSSLTPAEDIRDGKWFHFPLKSGTHPLFDGRGIVRGTVAARTVRLNYGQQKEINGERCYYAFSTSILPEGASIATHKIGASGWIKASALQDGNDPQYSAEVVRRMQPPPLEPTPGTPFRRYEITGGDPQATVFGYVDEKKQFVAYKVLPGVARDGRASVASTDYLRRSDDVINLGFNVAGVSNDTYRVSSPKRPLWFHRAPTPDATANIDLYFPKDATHEGTQPCAKMVFVYGYVEEGSDAKRWGWIPLGALKPATPL